MDNLAEHNTLKERDWREGLNKKEVGGICHKSALLLALENPRMARIGQKHWKNSSLGWHCNAAFMGIKAAVLGRTNLSLYYTAIPYIYSLGHS